MKRKNLKENSPEKAAKSRKSDSNVGEKQLMPKVVIDEKTFIAEVKELLKNQATLLTGLTKLRDALRQKEEKGLSIFVELVKMNSECPEIYKTLEKGRQTESPLELQISLEVLEELLLMTAGNASYSAVGMYHVRKLLQNHLKLLYSCLNPSGHHNMIKGTLKLLVAMVAQGAFAAREVVAVFDFTLKVFGGLVNKRDVKNHHSIRTWFIKFVMSFLMFGDDATIRHILDIKGFVSSIFKLLPSDPLYVITMVIKTLQEKVVKNTQVPKKTKVQLFSSYVLTQLSRLYKYKINEDDDEDSENLREMVHELLQDVCCTFKHGICFANKLGMFAGRSNNPVLLRFLQSIPKNDHNPVFQQLVIKILMCCPDLVHPYLTSLKITYEPRLSLPWITNFNFIIKIFSTLPLPSVMINKANIELNKDSLLQSALNTVFPAVVTRMNLNQGLQHSSLLVKDTTLTLIKLVLDRAADLLELCNKDSSSSNAASFSQLFTDGLIKALPDVKTVVSLRQNLLGSKEKVENVLTVDKDYQSNEDSALKECKPSKLLSSAIQVLYGYQKVQPFILSSLNFDLGKLLPGPEQLNETMFPETVQHYTLKILLDLPQGAFKWYHKKSKQGQSHMYSILKMFVSCQESDIKSAAQSVLTKFLCDEGIIEDSSHEIEIWLKHLYSKTFAYDQDAVLLFLDSVFYSVAMEPYTYTDIVMEMTSQARVANKIVPLQDSVDSSSRVAFSPLVVRALMSHVESVSSVQDGFTAKQLGHVAQYINLVVLDFLHNMVNPLPLLLTVQRFYGNMRLSGELSILHNAHHSLLKYSSVWTGNLDEVHEKEEGKKSTKKLLKTFLKKTDPSNDDLATLLCCLCEDQLRDALIALLRVCSSKLDVTTLADHVTSTPYCLIGSLQVCEEILKLAKELPFPTLVWQLFGPVIANTSVTQTDVALCDCNALQHQGMQEILVDSLQRQSLASYPTMCNHLLNYLSAFISALCDSDCITDDVTSHKDSVTKDLKTALALVFKLLETMINKLCHVEKPSHNLSHEANDEKSTETDTSTVNRDKLRDVCKAFFGHPVLNRCFVIKPEDRKQGFPLSEVVTSLSHIARTILDNVHVDEALVRPYIDVICSNARMVISQATHRNEFPSDSQSLQLLQVFSSYCDHKNRSQVISSLLELPLTKLISHNKTKGTKNPTAFYQTLLVLLDAYHKPHVTSTANRDSASDQQSANLAPDLNHVISTANENSALSNKSFERLIEIAMAISSPELDDVIHNVIKSSPWLLILIKSTFLDYCLDNATHERISMATTMVSTSIPLLKHFERRCCAKSKDKGIVPLKVEHLSDFLPLMKCYLNNVLNIRDSIKENKAMNLIYKKYWSYLWEWLLKDKQQVYDSEDINCDVLELLIRWKDSDSHSLTDKLMSLINMAPNQDWDLSQISVVQTILTCLPKNDDNSVLVWAALSACMNSVSKTLSTGSTVQKTLKKFDEFLAKNKEQLVKCAKGSVFDADVWISFVKSCLKYNFGSVMTFKCMSACIKLLYTSTRRKSLATAFPLTMIYELVLTHSKFLEFIMDENKNFTEQKEAVLSLIVAIAEMTPDCCQQSHLPVFFAAYSATLSKSDQQILYLLHLYERAQVSLSSHRPYLWGKAALEQHKMKKTQGPSLWQQPSTSEVLEMLDEAELHRSAREFPLHRKLRPRVQEDVDCSSYDPGFMIPLFCHLLAPNTEVDCRKFVERGGLGYSVAGLSSRDDHMRKAAGHVLSRYLTHLEAASFREKKQILLLLVSFKNGITDVNARVSSVITRFISRAVHVMLRPEHQMYFILNSFLLQRASMDLREVPLFYTLFNSSSLQYRNERVWILELLVEGLRDAQDYYVYKKRHVMELVMSFHDSQLSDPQSRKLVIGLLRASLTIHSAAFDLAKHYGIVGWIHSLCLKRKNESLGTSLSLLHTLWFTIIQHGKPSACENDVSGEEDHLVPVPPNLAHETLLVCKTFIRFLSCEFTLEDATLLFELLSSVLNYLGKELPQGSQLTPEELLSLITLWSSVFNEGRALSLLMDEVGLNVQQKESFSRNGSNGVMADCKTKTLSQLIDIITQSRAIVSHTEDSSLVITLLACNFALEFSPSKDDVTLCLRHRQVVTWFGHGLFFNTLLLKLFLSPKGEHTLRRFLYLYSFVDVRLMQELNAMFLLMVSRVKHVHDDVLGPSANEVARLLSGGVYSEILSAGLSKAMDPDTDEGESNVSGSSVDTVTELVGVFLQDLWFGQPVPSRFLDTVVKSRSDGAFSFVPQWFGKITTTLAVLVEATPEF